MGTRRLFDLSHTIEAGMVTYPGLPAPVISEFLTRPASRALYAEGTEFSIGSVSMVGNTGTYLDSPFHRDADGADLSELSLEQLCGIPAVRIDLTGLTARGIGPGDLAGREVAGMAVLLHTGWDRHFGRPSYAVDAPFLTGAGALLLVAGGAVLVGIDSVNIDEVVPGGPRPAHTELLRAGIPVVEHLTRLGDVPEAGAWFTAVPPKVAGLGTFPVRAFAEVRQPT